MLGAEAGQALLEALAARVGKLPAAHLGHVERKAVDRDVVALVAAHRADQARAVEGADLDVALARADERGGQVEQGEDVLGGEVRDSLDDVVEAATLRHVRARVVLEEAGELSREALDVHRARNLAAGC